MALHVGALCPSFQGATEWIGDDTSTQKLMGQPFIVIFWSVSCPACLARFPKIQNWLDEYGDCGLNIVAVHSPRLPSDFDVEQVRGIFQSQDVTIPCAIDNERKLSEEFQTEGIWPYYFLFGRDGKMKSRAASELGFKLLENALRACAPKVPQVSSDFSHASRSSPNKSASQTIE